MRKWLFERLRKLLDTATDDLLKNLVKWVAGLVALLIIGSPVVNLARNWLALSSPDGFLHIAGEAWHFVFIHPVQVAWKHPVIALLYVLWCVAAAILFA